ncbi:protein kinase family protein [Hespellia stercorisuis]|uniref:Uncharacterized protein n=1 Tax=Hespellia stercorisuis DSM 15480 TaxID=1121950 RepID=A0A1M6K0K8_9FIRM|nr:hypothetical protein [Hespellia stercorisuis]SHJ52470.1 hypothetical protein SAMN02745243_00806 [Hespellia stercorisuis DSM 15480]
MEELEGYEVIRFLEHDGRCHVSMDFVKGQLLIRHLKEEPQVTKAQLFEWLRSLARQIEQYHRCRKNQCYRYLNPESILVREDKKLLFLDLAAVSNEFVIRDMQKRVMRRHFVKKVLTMSGNPRLETDLYSLGKSMQYILAHTQVEPPLSRTEEHQLSKIISKCLGENPKRTYQDFNQIQKEIPRIQHPKIKKIKKQAVAAVLVLLVVAAGVNHLTGRGGGDSEGSAVTGAAVTVPEESTITKAEDAGQENAEQKDAGQKDAGQEDTGQDAAVQNNKTVQDSKTAENSGVEKEMKNMQTELEQIEEAIQQNTTADNKIVIDQARSLESKLLRYLATAYDREEMVDEAIAAYGQACAIETDGTILEQLYQRRADLEEKAGKPEQARSTYSEAMEKLENTQTIGVRFAGMICGDTSLSVEEKNKYLQQIVESAPGILSEKAFQKLQREQGVQVEGDKVWIEKEEKE